MRLPALLCVSVCLCAAPGPVAGADKSCADLRQFYTGKGFTLAGVPLTEISGEHLRMCPQGPTCCTSSMEENLAGLTAQETEGLIREAGRSLQAAFNALHRSFDTYFTELHSQSERSLQEALSPLGPLYSQNTRLYGDLYTDLRQYYRGSALNLDETLSEFWSRLLERTFKTSAPAEQVSLSEDYLECVAKQQETLRPFGDVPRDMKAKVIRAFVTARSFVQGLIVSGEVVRKVSQVSLSPECMKALMKLIYCSHCRGMASVKPCSNYCSNVMKGCLANQADLDPEWQNLIDTMIQVVSSFSTEPSLDVVLSSIPARIYEAVHYQQQNMDTFTAKVYQTCGAPGEPGTGSPALHEQRRKSGSLTASEYKPSPTAGLRLEMQVSDLSSKLREMRQYWTQLPMALCSKLAAGGANQDKCWNGITRARYLPEVMGDGLANQINNPEVELDITKPDMTIRQQIMQLKIMSSKLKNALEGNDVDFQDASDDISGSGSGMCVGGQCSRSRPGLYAFSPDNNRVRGAATSQTRLCSLLLLLPLVILLLQR
ncbi:glypican-1 isoform X1 [Trachinotus anak]|uniref:glypican-1 isoform X1 n=1 Tax=Trachinotus anak TaxID=443729 RepID=UPI0039F1F2D9